MELVFHNVSYNVPNGSASAPNPTNAIRSKFSFNKIQYKQVLNNVSGCIEAGKLSVIIGPSGSGKTSLLDVLAGRRRIGRMGGRLILRNVRSNVSSEIVYSSDIRQFNQISGYVMQDDVFMENLTVKETVDYAFDLKVPLQHQHEKTERVNEVLLALNLKSIESSIVGSQLHRGISGGERRRLSVAIEMITRPKILFLDEPTSGLDSCNAFKVINALKGLCLKMNTSVVCSVHQPSSVIFRATDCLLVMSKGCLIFNGPALDSIEFFSRKGFECPVYMNPAEFIIDICLDGGDDEVAGVATNDDNRFQLTILPFPLNDSSSASSASATYDASTSSSCISRADPTVCSNYSTPTFAEPYAISQVSVSTVHSSLHSGAVSNFAPQIDSCVDLTDCDISMSSDSLCATPTNIHITSLAQFITGLTNISAISNASVTSIAATKNKQTTTAGNFQRVRHMLPSACKSVCLVTSLREMLRKTAILTCRNWKNTSRASNANVIRTLTAIIMAVFVGLIFFQLKADATSKDSRIGALNFTMCIFTLFGLPALTHIIDDRLLFERERSSSAYTTLPYFISTMIVEFPILMSIVFCYGTIVYWMVGLNPLFSRFLYFLLVLLLVINVGFSWCQAIASFCRSSNLAIAIYVIVLAYSLLLGGFIVKINSIPGFIRWTKYVSNFYFGFEGMSINEFSGSVDAAGDYGDQILIGLNSYNLNKWHDVWFLLLWFLALRMIAFVRLSILRT